MDDYKSIYESTQKFHDVRMNHWLTHDLYSFSWWLLVVFTIVPWFIWWKKVDKSKLVELVCYGSILAVISLILDTIGTTNNWWMYKTELFIQFPGLLVPDIVDIPVVYMLVYQYCPRWKSFLITMGVVSIIFAFVLEPALRWIETYQPLTWKHFYSSIVYFSMAVIVRYLVLRLKRMACV